MRSNHAAASAAAVAVAGAVMFGGLVPAYADNASFSATPSPVHPGGTVTLKYSCGAPAMAAELWVPDPASAAFLFAGRKLLQPATGSIKITVGTTAPPGTYKLSLQCLFGSGEIVGHADVMLTVMKPPPPKPHVIVHTGFGGMARWVAQHHPLR